MQEKLAENSEHGNSQLHNLIIIYKTKYLKLHTNYCRVPGLNSVLIFRNCSNLLAKKRRERPKRDHSEKEKALTAPDLSTLDQRLLREASLRERIIVLKENIF